MKDKVRQEKTNELVKNKKKVKKKQKKTENFVSR